MTIKEIKTLSPTHLEYAKYSIHPRNPGYYRGKHGDFTIEISKKTMEIFNNERGSANYGNPKCDKFSFDFIGYEYTLEAKRRYSYEMQERIKEHTICALTYINPGDPRDESEYRKKMIEKAAIKDATTREGYYKNKSFTLTNLRDVIDEIYPFKFRRNSPYSESVSYTEFDFKPSEAYWSYKFNVYRFQGMGKCIHMLKSTIDSIFSNDDLDSNILYRDSMPKWCWRRDGVYLMTSEDANTLEPWFLPICRIEESAKTLEMQYEQEYLDIEDRQKYDDNQYYEKCREEKREEEKRLEIIDRKENPWRYEEREYVPDDPWDSIGPDEGWSRDGRPD